MIPGVDPVIMKKTASKLDASKILNIPQIMHYINQVMMVMVMMMMMMMVIVVVSAAVAVGVVKWCVRGFYSAS